MKKLLTLLALAELFFLLPMTVRAQHTVVNVVEQTASVTRTSTLYVGEVLLDGQQSFYYLYSEDMTNSDYIFGAVRNCLSDFKDGIYSALVPIIDGTTEEIGISLCSNSDYESMMNSDWKQAEKAGLACLPNMKVTSSSSDNLYETDADFAEKCPGDFKDITLLDDVGESMAVSGIIAQLSAVNTDRVTYTVENGVLVKHIERHINFTCEMTTVIYTKVELASGSASSVLGDVNGDGDVSVNDVAMIVNYILGIIDSNFIIANADINGDGEIDINDVMGTVSIILEGNQEEPKIPSKKLNIFVGQQKEDDYPLDYGSGLLQVNSSNPTVATGEIDEEHNQLILTGISEGQTLITVSDMDNTKILKIDVTVSLLCPDDNHPHMVDLGLPSGTKWACCNVGATTPEGYGGLYTWGETEEKSYYDWETYQYCNSSTGVIKDLGPDIAGTKFDVAHEKWGGSWRMPSETQIQELLDYCTYKGMFMTCWGGLFIGPSGGCIFLPSAGYSWWNGLDGRSDEDFFGSGGYEFYWSSTQSQYASDSAYFLDLTPFHEPPSQVLTYFRCIGMSVRPVCK